LALNTAPGANTFLAVFLGDGKGNFTADSNSYYAGNSNNILPGLPGFSPVSSLAVLARLNNQSPQLSKDIALDYLTWTNDGATALLNQINPAPGAAQPVPSRTQLAVSATSVVTNQDLTFTVTVTGIAPTGNVTFRSGTTTFEVPITNGIASVITGLPAGAYSFTASYPGDTNNNASTSNTVTVTVTPAPTTTALSASSSSVNQGQLITYTATVTARYNPTGTVTFTSGTTTLGKSDLLSNGVAPLQVFATTACTYSVTASYSGDPNNQPSTSNAVSITVVAPDYTVSASPASATITAGQSATTTLTVTPAGGYNGTIKFSCGTLPTGASCAFAPATLTPANTTPATTTLTTTATTTASLHNGISGSLQGIAWAAGLVFLAFSPRRMRGLNSRLMRASLLTFLFAAGLLSLWLQFHLTESTCHHPWNASWSASY
jgi:Bacterial Ig-like domain (group 3)